MLKPARFLDPKSDVVFKKIFGHHPAIIKSFLNGVLPLEEGHLIEQVTYLTPEQSPRVPGFKNSIVDVKCQDQKGRIFIVEMQLSWSESFKQRLLFGASKAYVQQLQKGEHYNKLCPVYGLGILNVVFDPSPEWFHHFRTVNIKDSSQVLEGLELIFLELPKFIPQNFAHRKMGVLWLRFLKEVDEHLTEVPAEFLHDPELNLAVELAQESAYTEAELAQYDRYWDAVSVENTIKADALLEGERRGLVEGEKLGKKKEKLEIAQKMRESGMDKQLIANLTGLSLEEF